MIRIGNKIYKPKPITIGISLGMLILAAGMVEGATTIWQLLLPITIAAVIGSIALIGER